MSWQGQSASPSGGGWRGPGAWHWHECELARPFCFAIAAAGGGWAGAIIMIVVSTINMVVALLVLILERTQMIGILKSMGANNWSIRKIFLYNALYLIVRGLFWGNSIGIALLLIQKYFGVIKLNPESYYVNVAPVDINLGYFLLLNIGTVVICLLVLLIPSYIVTKISPAKTIRFD